MERKIPEPSRSYGRLENPLPVKEAMRQIVDGMSSGRIKSGNSMYINTMVTKDVRMWGVTRMALAELTAKGILRQTSDDAYPMYAYVPDKLDREVVRDWELD